MTKEECELRDLARVRRWIEENLTVAQQEHYLNEAISWGLDGDPFDLIYLQHEYALERSMPWVG